MRPGGKKCKSWRLKKKYNKWFSSALCKLIRDTLEDLPQGLLEKAWSGE